MSRAFDNFLAGKSPLAQLLKEQPSFEAPDGMFERVLGALDSPEASLAFEPPASLEAAILAEAIRLDAAQRPRREAVLDRISAGDDASTVLGAPVSEPTGQWLADRARERPTSTLPKKPRFGWFRGLGVAVAAALAASVALKVWFDPMAPGSAVPPLAREPITRAQPDASSSAVAEREAPERADSPPLEARKRAARPRAEADAAQAFAPAAKPELLRAAPPEGLGANIAKSRPAPPPAPKAEADDAPVAAAAPGAIADGPTAPIDTPRTPGENAAIVLPLDMPAAQIAARLLKETAGDWRWQVSVADTRRALEIRHQVMTAFDHAQRPDSIRLEFDEGIDGVVHITRDSD